MDKFIYYNIHDFLNANKNKENGENCLKDILSVFTCPKNLDVEYFIKKTLSNLQKNTNLLHIYYFVAKLKIC